MRTDSVEIVRQFLGGTSRTPKAEMLVSPNAVFVDLSSDTPGGSRTVRGRHAFLEATAALRSCTLSGELIVNSLFGSGGNVAGFGTVLRSLGGAGPTIPVSIWAKVTAGRIHFFQYIEAGPPADIVEEKGDENAVVIELPRQARTMAKLRGN